MELTRWVREEGGGGGKKKGKSGSKNVFTNYNYKIYKNYSTLLKMGGYSSTAMCQYWDNRLIYWEYTDYFTSMSQ